MELLPDYGSMVDVQPLLGRLVSVEFQWVEGRFAILRDYEFSSWMFRWTFFLEDL